MIFYQAKLSYSIQRISTGSMSTVLEQQLVKRNCWCFCCALVSFKVSLAFKSKDFCSNYLWEFCNRCVVSFYNIVVTLSFCSNSIFNSFKRALQVQEILI